MARWVAIFTDMPGMSDIRERRGQEHLTYLARHGDRILIGGGLRDTPEGRFVGGLWVLEVKDRAEAVQLIESDPYFEPQLRSYRLFTWGKALESRMVTL